MNLVSILMLLAPLGISGLAIASIVRIFQQIRAERILEGHLHARMATENGTLPGFEAPDGLQKGRSLIEDELTKLPRREQRQILDALNQPSENGRTEYVKKILLETEALLKREQKLSA